jgi:hypothetical protein
VRRKLTLAALALSLPLLAGFASGGPARAATLPLPPHADPVSADRPADCAYYHWHHHHHHWRHHHHRRHWHRY